MYRKINRLLTNVNYKLVKPDCRVLTINADYKNPSSDIDVYFGHTDISGRKLLKETKLNI